MKKKTFIQIILVVLIIFGAYVFIYNYFFGDRRFIVNNELSDTEAPIRIRSPNVAYRRDSMFVATTVWQFINKKVGVFDYYKQYEIPVTKLRIDVDSIIYSPDSLKLFAFVIERVPEIENNKPNEYFYGGNPLIGFRKSVHEPWKIYSFGQFTPTGFKNYNKVRDLFRGYFLGDGKFKNDSDYYWDGVHNDTLEMNQGSNRVAIKFGYNIDDKRFWDSSIVWKKGSRIPGYYAFQTTGNVAPGYTDSPIRIIPSLKYPDSLLQLYK